MDWTEPNRTAWLKTLKLTKESNTFSEFNFFFLGVKKRRNKQEAKEEGCNVIKLEFHYNTGQRKRQNNSSPHFELRFCRIESNVECKIAADASFLTRNNQIPALISTIFFSVRFPFITTTFSSSIKSFVFQDFLLEIARKHLFDRTWNEKLWNLLNSVKILTRNFPQIF